MRNLPVQKIRHRLAEVHDVIALLDDLMAVVTAVPIHITDRYHRYLAERDQLDKALAALRK